MNLFMKICNFINIYLFSAHNQSQPITYLRTSSGLRHCQQPAIKINSYNNILFTMEWSVIVTLCNVYYKSLHATAKKAIWLYNRVITQLALSILFCGILLHERIMLYILIQLTIYHWLSKHTYVM